MFSSNFVSSENCKKHARTLRKQARTPLAKPISHTTTLQSTHFNVAFCSSDKFLHFVLHFACADFFFVVFNMSSDEPMPPANQHQPLGPSNQNVQNRATFYGGRGPSRQRGRGRGRPVHHGIHYVSTAPPTVAVIAQLMGHRNPAPHHYQRRHQNRHQPYSRGSQSNARAPAPIPNPNWTREAPQPGSAAFNRLHFAEEIHDLEAYIKAVEAMKIPKADCTEPKGTFGSWNMETKKNFMRYISKHPEWLIQANMQLYGIPPMKHRPVY